MGVGHFLFSLALGATRFPVGSFHVVHQFSFRNEDLSFLSWDLLHSWGISEIQKKGFAWVFFASIKHDQTLVRLQEPFHILHRPSLIGKTWVFPKIRGVSPKMDGENHGKPDFLMDDLGGFNPLFSETSTCTSWDPLNLSTSCRLSGMISPYLGSGWTQWRHERVSNCTTWTYLDIQSQTTETEKIWLDPPQNSPKTPKVRRYDWMSRVVRSNFSMKNILQLSRCVKRTLPFLRDAVR